MAIDKKRAFDVKFKERAVALAKERKNVARAARELEISGSLLPTWIIATETAAARGKGLLLAVEEKLEFERHKKLVAE